MKVKAVAQTGYEGLNLQLQMNNVNPLGLHTRLMCRLKVATFLATGCARNGALFTTRLVRAQTRIAGAASAACGPADRQYRANGCVTTRATAIGMSLKIVSTGLCGRPVRCAMVQWRASRVSTARSLSAKTAPTISPILPPIAAAVILCGWSNYGRGLTTSFCAHVPRTCSV